MLYRETASMLNQLIGLSKDGEQDFARAARGFRNHRAVVREERELRSEALRPGMKPQLPQPRRTILERQHKIVVMNHARIRDLRDHYRR